MKSHNEVNAPFEDCLEFTHTAQLESIREATVKSYLTEGYKARSVSKTGLW